MSGRIFAIDPGNVQSAYVVINKANLKPIKVGLVVNEELRDIILGAEFYDGDEFAIEMIQNLGMGAVGQTIFDTAFWVGRFFEGLTRRGLTGGLVYRMEEKRYICHNTQAKDTNIRQALVDRFAAGCSNNGKGTVKCPGWFYGFHDDIWMAYAVAITYAERGPGG